MSWCCHYGTSSLWHLPGLTLNSSHVTCNNCTSHAHRKYKCLSEVKKGIYIKTFTHPLKEKWCTVYSLVLFVILSKHLTVQASSSVSSEHGTPAAFYKPLLAVVQNTEKLLRHIPCSCCNFYKLISYFTRGIKIMIFVIITMMMMMT